MKVASLLWVLVALGCASCGGGGGSEQACSRSADCTDPALPYCVAGACVACDGASTCSQEAPRCEADTHSCVGCLDDSDCNTYAMATHCDTTAGACVQCVTSDQCSGATPVCDADQSCRACTADDECASNVCDAASGACADTTTVIYAAPNATATATCTQADPCQLVKAFSLVAAGHNIVKLGTGTYPDNVNYASTTNVDVHAKGAVLKGVLALNSGATISIHGGKFLSDGGLYCRPATTGGAKPHFDIEDAVFDQAGTQSADPYAIQASSCVIAARRTTFSLADGGIGFYASGELMPGRGTEITLDRVSFKAGEPSIGVFNYSSFHVTNGVFYGYKPLESHPAATAFTWDSTSINNVIEYSTVYDSVLACGNTGITYTKTYNSVFVNTRVNPQTNMVPVATIAGSNCESQYTLGYPQSYEPPGTNNFFNMDPMLKDPTHGDFHLMTGSPAIDVADPASQLMLDYEGTARPQGPARDIGALEFK